MKSIRVTKREWHDRYGGLTNSNCWRRQSPNGRWNYFVVLP